MVKATQKIINIPNPVVPEIINKEKAEEKQVEVTKFSVPVPSI